MMLSHSYVLKDQRFVNTGMVSINYQICSKTADREGDWNGHLQAVQNLLLFSVLWLMVFGKDEKVTNRAP